MQTFTDYNYIILHMHMYLIYTTYVYIIRPFCRWDLPALGLGGRLRTAAPELPLLRVSAPQAAAGDAARAQCHGAEDRNRHGC